MKIFNYLSLLLLLFTVNLFAQKNVSTAKVDVRLYDVFGKSYIDNLSKTDANQFLYLNFFLENSYYVASLNSEKPIEGTDIHKVSMKNNANVFFNEKVYDKKTFNPHKYNFVIDQNNFITYIWREAGIAIIFHPKNHITQDFDNYIRTK